MSEGETSADWYLCTDDTISTIETLGKHVHRTSLSVSNTLTTTKKFANNGLYGSASHKSETVTSVCSNDIVFLVDGVFDTDGDGLLTSGQMTETTNLLLFIQSVCSHFHTSVSKV